MIQGMKRGSLIGLPVISGKTGNKLGVVADIIFKPGQEKIEGIVISGGGWSIWKKYVPLTKIRNIGQYAIIIEENNVNSDENIDVPVKTRGQYGNQLLGYQIIRGDGQELGHISDIILDPNDGTVEGFEVSKGLIDDLMEGRYVLPYDISNTVNQDSIIVSTEQADQLKSYDKGIKNLFNGKQ